MKNSIFRYRPSVIIVWETPSHLPGRAIPDFSGDKLENIEKHSFQPQRNNVVDDGCHAEIRLVGLVASFSRFARHFFLEDNLLFSALQ
jgi:hypothetical protein